MHDGIRARDYGISPGSGFFLDEDNIDAGLADFDELGIRWIRSNIPWKNFQPEDPRVVGEEASYNWKGVDAFAATMNNTRWVDRFAIVCQISNVPDWATKNITPGDGPIPLPFDLQCFANAAGALAKRLYGTAHVFEIQNSPNIGKKGAAHGDNLICDWPVPDPYGYAQLLKLVHPAIHAARPKAVVLIGGIGGTRNVEHERIAADEFLEGIYGAGGKDAFDGVSYHPYSQPVLPCAAGDAICAANLDYVNRVKNPYGMTNGWTRMLNAREVMVANGDDTKQIWITEFGGPTDSLTEEEQSDLLVAGATRASQYEWTRIFNWFTYTDGNNDTVEVGGNSMGLIRRDGTRKPAFDAYKTLIAPA